MNLLFRFVFTVAGGALLASAAYAQTGVTTAVFSNIALAGNSIALDNSVVFNDNTGTAFYNVSNNYSTTFPQTFASTLVYGANPSSSIISFLGKPVPADPYQPFDLGTLTYTNGTSQINSLVFGATVTFTASPLNGEVPSGTSQLTILTTSNIGDAGSAQHDADFITLSGLANQSFNVLEGQSATAELFGKYVNDPEIVLTGIVLNPGQGGAGFLGNGSAVPVPETSNFLAGLAVLSLIGYEFFQRRRLVRTA